MAKWRSDLPGCSGHIHQSLWSAGKKNVFHAGTGTRSLSRTFEHYIAGQLHCLPEILPLFAPTINSYKRLVEGAWAPHQGELGHRQPHDRLARDPRQQEEHAARDTRQRLRFESVLGPGGSRRERPLRHRARARAPTARDRERLRRPGRRELAEKSCGGDRSLRVERALPPAFRRRVRCSLRRDAPLGVASVRQSRDGLGSSRATSRSSSVLDEPGHGRTSQVLSLPVQLPHAYSVRCWCGAARRRRAHGSRQEAPVARHRSRAFAAASRHRNALAAGKRRPFARVVRRHLGEPREVSGDGGRCGVSCARCGLGDRPRWRRRDRASRRRSWSWSITRAISSTTRTTNPAPCRIDREIPYWVSVPTTAGTGSEG